ncbi:hypothetical protein SVIOM74S_02477 [Streptomyces violarus]
MGGDAYRTAFLEGAGAFVDRAGDGVLEGLPAELRIKWRLVRERRLEELLTVLAFERANGAGTFAVEGLPGRRWVVYPGVRGVSARLARTDVPAVARLVEARWGADGKLRLHGYAYLAEFGTTRWGAWFGRAAGVPASATSSGRPTIAARRSPAGTVKGKPKWTTCSSDTAARPAAVPGPARRGGSPFSGSFSVAGVRRPPPCRASAAVPAAT